MGFTASVLKSRIKMFQDFSIFMLHFNSRGLIFLWISVFLGASLSAHPLDSNATVKADSAKYWKATSAFGLTFNQLSLTNWASGGESSVSGKANIDFKINYKKNQSSFELKSKTGFGIVGYGSKRLEKTEDRIDFATSFSQEAFNNWTYTSLFTFKSQFANGYKYPNDSTLISAFMAPGYLTASLGFKFMKTDKFELFLSPASGKFTVVNVQSLADKGAFGVKKAVLDSTGAVTVPGNNLLAEFGINVLASFNHSFTDDIDLATMLNLYNNYLDENQGNRWNIDVDWETKINFTINKRIQTVVFLLLKYDHDIMVPIYEMDESRKKQIGEGPRLQVKESLGLGFSYKIG